MSKLLRPSDTIITDLDGVFHDHPTGSGALVWANLAYSGHWDAEQNKNGHNGTTAVAAFFEETAGVTDPHAHNLSADNHLFDFVNYGQRLGVTYDEFRAIAEMTIRHIIDNDHLHDRIVAEVANHRKTSPEKPTIFITFSPLIIGQLLVEELFGKNGVFIFSPNTVTRDTDGEALFIQAYHTIEEAGKGAFAEQVLADFHIDRRQTTGFGDTASDISLLDMLARPFAVKLTGTLLSHAKAQGIPILGEEHVRTKQP